MSTAITAIINASAAWAGSPNSFMYNISNFSTASCQGLAGPINLGVPTYSHGVGYDNLYVYWPRNTTTLVGTIKLKDNSTWAADGYWSSFTEMAMPNKSDNSTTYFRNNSYIGADHRIYKYYSGSPASSYPSLKDIYGLPGEVYFWDMIKEGSFTYIYFMGYGRIYKANWTLVENTSYSDCTFPTYNGTYCIGATSYTTVSGCTNTTDTCVAGTFCQQLTPQMNVTNDLIENYTECKLYYKIGGWTPCSNLCWRGNVLWSNCWDYPSNSSGCQQCPYNQYPYYSSSEGVHTKTWYSNQSTVSVPSWTIACINSTNMGVQYVIDADGANTTVIGLLTQAGNNVTEGVDIGGSACYNTSTTCYETGTCNTIACFSSSDSRKSVV